MKVVVRTAAAFVVAIASGIIGAALDGIGVDAPPLFWMVGAFGGGISVALVMSEKEQG